ncbi:MAG TPA: hypothetical protein VM778_11220 [Gemmatimonadota bacterium]|nr:hypothetical protein [Gemmatimonadota bacterium]
MSAGCEREAGVVRAVLEGRWPAELSGHAATCADCREVRAVTAWMQDVAHAARAEAAEARLPSPAGIWWKAEVLRRVEQRRSLTHRAIRPIAVFERVVWGAVAALAGALAWLRWDELGEWIAGTGIARAMVGPDASLALAGVSAVLLVASAWAVMAGGRRT